VAVGGNEDKEHDLSVLRHIVSLVKSGMPHVEVITTASNIPEELGKQYINAFNKIGVESVGLIHTQNRSDGNNEDYIKRVSEADIVYFTGGDQLKITSILGGSPLLKMIKKRYFEEDCIIAGTSAGSTAMPSTMIYGGESEEALTKSAVHMTAGVGFVRNIVIDSHFIKRGRFSRLMEVVTTNPSHVGVGLGEDTAVIIRKGHLLEAIGTGLVVLFDGQNIAYTNLSSIEDNESIAVENVVVHTIVKGHGYDILERAYLRPDQLYKVK